MDNIFANVIPKGQRTFIGQEAQRDAHTPHNQGGNIFEPAQKLGIIVSNENYYWVRQDPNFKSFGNINKASENANRIHTLFQTHLGIQEVWNQRDANYMDLEQIGSMLKGRLIEAHRNPSKRIYVAVYFSGHGVQCNNQSFACLNDQDPTQRYFPLEGSLFNMTQQFENTFISLFFDASRESVDPSYIRQQDLNAFPRGVYYRPRQGQNFHTTYSCFTDSGILTTSTLSKTISELAYGSLARNHGRFDFPQSIKQLNDLEPEAQTASTLTLTLQLRTPSFINVDIPKHNWYDIPTPNQLRAIINVNRIHQQYKDNPDQAYEQIQKQQTNMYQQQRTMNPNSPQQQYQQQEQQDYQNQNSMRRQPTIGIERAETQNYRNSPPQYQHQNTNIPSMDAQTNLYNRGDSMIPPGRNNTIMQQSTNHGGNEIGNDMGQERESFQRDLTDMMKIDNKSVRVEPVRHDNFSPPRQSRSYYKNNSQIQPGATGEDHQIEMEKWQGEVKQWNQKDHDDTKLPSELPFADIQNTDPNMRSSKSGSIKPPSSDTGSNQKSKDSENPDAEVESGDDQWYKYKYQGYPMQGEEEIPKKKPKKDKNDKEKKKKKKFKCTTGICCGSCWGVIAALGIIIYLLIQVGVVETKAIEQVYAEFLHVTFIKRLNNLNYRPDMVLQEAEPNLKFCVPIDAKPDKVEDLPLKTDKSAQKELYDTWPNAPNYWEVQELENAIETFYGQLPKPTVTLWDVLSKQDTTHISKVESYRYQKKYLSGLTFYKDDGTVLAKFGEQGADTTLVNTITLKSDEYIVGIKVMSGTDPNTPQVPKYFWELQFYTWEINLLEYL